MVKTQYGNSSMETECKLNDSLFYGNITYGNSWNYHIILLFPKKKKERNNLECALIKEINDIEHNSEIVDHTFLEDKKTALEKLRKEKLHGHFVRSRAKWVELGEKPTKYFCHLESRNFLNKTIKKIVNTRGEIIYDQSEIMNNVKIFYENLYKNFDHELNDIDIHSVISFPSVPCLDDNVSKKFDEHITEKEVLQVL